jgi:hypothetical protein
MSEKMFNRGVVPPENTLMVYIIFGSSLSAIGGLP